MLKKVTKTHCIGCRNNFYNYPNDLGVKECWSLKDAKLVTKYAIKSYLPANVKRNYTKTKKPSCYHQNGTVYVDSIPNYAK